MVNFDLSSSLLAGFALLAQSPFFADAVPQSSSSGPDPSIELGDGKIIGTTGTIPDLKDPVNKYLGIPYAKTPPLRFGRAEDPEQWTEAKDVKDLKPSCIQQFNRPISKELFNKPGAPESEDCLYINVYTPSTSAPPEGRAVMFWIYGGSLQFGNSWSDEYDGSYLAGYEDVIVVTFNYRTNVFGFPNSPDIGIYDQNLALLDQRKALDWVQKNIKAFGGDPKKVAIFGESAGGFSVKMLWALPPRPVPFHGAIIQSQGGAGPTDGGIAWRNLTKTLNCTATPSKKEIDCVRDKPVDLIRSIIEKNRLNFAPKVENRTAATHIENQIRLRTAARVPMLIGSNGDEGSIFQVVFGFQKLNQTLQYFFPNQTVIQQAVQTLYRRQYPNNEIAAIRALIRDASYTCFTSAIAQTAASNQYQAFRYYYNATFDNLPVPKNLVPNPGAFHSSEIFEVFGTYPKDGATQQQKDLSRYMMKAWADFAKNPRVGPDTDNGWPQIGASFRDLWVIGNEGRSGGYPIRQEVTDANCRLFSGPLWAVGL
ncbi:carboxylesterase hlo [Phyllosticta citricarpa]|uniref:Carboxylic ester hydrolase n=2 Tax=Phyllosticta TaxID=121621 RepID=A0ABR1LV91_9PEZI